MIMKLSKYFLMAAAGLTLFACSNDEDIPGLNGEGTKSVALKLEGLSSGASTKAVGDPHAGDSDHKIALSNVTVYFTDGTNILATKPLASTSTADWADLIGDGYVFHQVPVSTTQVQIVGNASGKTLTATNVAALKASVLDAANEQTFTNVTLFGEDTSLEKASGPDEHGDVYTATVNLKPLVARFEIGNIACTDLGQPGCKITQYSLNVIGLMDFNSGVTLSGTASGTEYTLANVLEPGSEAEEGKVVFGATGTAASWAWDAISGDSSTNITGSTSWNPGPEGSQKFVYQFIPNKLKKVGEDPAKMAQIKLVLKDITWASNVSATDRYNSVVTAKFQKDEQDLTDFEAGKIYTVNYAFKSGNIGPWNPEDKICVQLNVTVSDWEVVALTPVFE